MGSYPSRLMSVAIDSDLTLTGCTPREAEVRVTDLPDDWVEDDKNRLFRGETPVSVWFSPKESYGNGMPFSDNAVLIVYRTEGVAWRECGPSLVTAAIADAISVPGWSSLGGGSPDESLDDQNSARIVGTLDSPYGSLLSIVTTSYVEREGCGFLIQLTATSLMSSSVVSSSDPVARIGFSTTA